MVYLWYTSVNSEWYYILVNPVIQLMMKQINQLMIGFELDVITDMRLIGNGTQMKERNLESLVQSFLTYIKQDSEMQHAMR